MTVEGSPQAMLNGDRLVVISSVSAWNLRSADPLSQAMGWGGDYGSWRTSTLTKFTVLDMDDRSAPGRRARTRIEGCIPPHAKSTAASGPSRTRGWTFPV